MVYKGGMKVKEGTYWDIRKFDRIDASTDSILPGAGDRYYIRASASAMLVVRPLVGLLFAVSLPFIGIATAIFQHARRVFKGTSGTMSRSLSFGRKPLDANLADSRKQKNIRKPYANVDEILKALNPRRNNTSRD